MTPEELRSLSDDQITAEAMNPIGVDSKNARAEMERRLIVALKESKRSADRFGRGIVGLTFVLVVLTVVLIFRASDSGLSPGARLAHSLAPSVPKPRR